MKLTILSLVLLFVLGGCATRPATYEVFERNMNFAIGKSYIPQANKKFREIYSEDKYIYKYSNNGCHYGYLTNRDDKPEKVIGWIIISGKEYCKLQPQMVEMM